MYICYDIKGIQRFIFSVPKLKCVIGASGLIEDFDRTTAVQQGAACGADRVFSGGGRGAFYCPSDQVAEDLARRLVEAAHQVGLDIRIGKDSGLSQAAHHADRLYPYCPSLGDSQEPLTDEPCAMSGLWPVPRGRAVAAKPGVHPLVWLRAQEGRKDRLGERILGQLLEGRLIPEPLTGYKLAFFKNVSPHPDDDEDEREETEAGKVALGGATAGRLWPWMATTWGGNSWRSRPGGNGKAGLKRSRGSGSRR